MTHRRKKTGIGSKIGSLCRFFSCNIEGDLPHSAKAVSRFTRRGNPHPSTKASSMPKLV
jgi:hypothetical protein